MAHVVCVWELGAGLGHLSRLVVVANELIGRGHQVTVVAKDLSKVEPLLRNTSVRLMQAPVWLPRLKEPALTKTVADILAYKGYGEVDGLMALVKAWRTLLAALIPDALIFDFAPTAMLAARDLPIPQVVFSNGFCAPATEGYAQDICPWVTVRKGVKEAREGLIVKNINTVARRLGLPTVEFVGNLFRATKTFITDLPAFDPYRPSRRDASYTGPAQLTPELPQWSWGSASGKKSSCI